MNYEKNLLTKFMPKLSSSYIMTVAAKSCYVELSLCIILIACCVCEFKSLFTIRFMICKNFCTPLSRYHLLEMRFFFVKKIPSQPEFNGVLTKFCVKTDKSKSMRADYQLTPNFLIAGYHIQQSSRDLQRCSQRQRAPIKNSQK